MTTNGSGEIPAAATESDTRTGVADARIALVSRARETPATRQTSGGTARLDESRTMKSIPTKAGAVTTSEGGG